MSRRTESLVNRRITVLVVVLVVAVSLAGHGAFSQASPSSNRKAINLPDDSPKAPFSGAILSGNTLYISGRIGIDSKTGNAPANLDEEIKLLLDHVKETLIEAGMTMDDLVYVQVACTDLSLYDKFNAAYRGYFTTKELPAREFRSWHCSTNTASAIVFSLAVPLRAPRVSQRRLGLVGSNWRPKLGLFAPISGVSLL